MGRICRGLAVVSLVFSAYASAQAALSLPNLTQAAIMVKYERGGGEDSAVLQLVRNSTSDPKTTRAGTGVIIIPLNGAPSSQWEVTPAPSNDDEDDGKHEPPKFMIVHRESRLALDIQRGDSRKGVGLWLWDIHGGPSQLFHIHVIEHGDIPAVTLSSVLNGLVIDVIGGHAVGGNSVHMWPYNDSPGQVWHLEPSPDADVESMGTFRKSTEVKLCEPRYEAEASRNAWLAEEVSASPKVASAATDECTMLSPSFRPCEVSEAFRFINAVGMYDERPLTMSWEWPWVKLLYANLACALGDMTGERDEAPELLALDRAAKRLGSLSVALEEELGLESPRSSRTLLDRWGWTVHAMFHSKSYPNPSPGDHLQSPEGVQGTGAVSGRDVATLHAGLDIARHHVAAVEKLGMLVRACLHRPGRCARIGRGTGQRASGEANSSDDLLKQPRKAVLLGHYYAGRKDPQRGCAPGYDRHAYVGNWSRSFLAKTSSNPSAHHVLLFHDGLSATFQSDFDSATNGRIMFEKVSLSGAREDANEDHDGAFWASLPPNDVRFLVTLRWVQDQLKAGQAESNSGLQPHDLVLITDVNDVVFHRNPFSFIGTLAPLGDMNSNMTCRNQDCLVTQVGGSYDLFIGDEAESSMAYALDAFYRCFREPSDRESTKSTGTIFNTGVVGGTAEAISWLLERMAEELKTSQHVKGRGAFACDMSALNKVLWGVLTKDPRFSYGCATSTLNDAECSNPLFWRVFSGYPLVSPFKAYVPADSDWHYIAHK